MDSIEYVGLVASTLATLAFLPQVVKTWRTGSADDFSLATLLMLEAGIGLWIFYGVMAGRAGDLARQWRHVRTRRLHPVR